MSEIKTRTIHKKKEIAKGLFLRSEMTQKEIAETISVAQKTVSKWVNSENWDTLRVTNKISIESLEQRILKRIETLLETETDVNADKIIKLSKTLRELRDKEPSGLQVVEVFKRYNEFILMRNIELAKENNLHQDAFLREYYF